MRALRWILGIVLGLVLLVVAALAGVWIWTGTEGSARWAVEQLARRQPVTAENVRGSIRNGVQADRLAWSQDGLAVEARTVDIAWQPLALLDRLLHLEHVRAASVRIDDQRPSTGEKPQLPASLKLPMRVALDDIAIGSIAVGGIEVRELAGRYGFDGSTHFVQLRSLRFQDGRYSGDARVGAEPPFDLQAALNGSIAAPVPGGTGPLPLVFEATARGNLQAFDAQARLRGDPASPAASQTRANVTARVTPFADLPVQSALADLEGLNVGALWPKAPQTLLAGRVEVQPQPGSAWRFSADLRNAAAGPWDRKKLPAERVRMQGEWRAPASTLLVRELDAQLGGGTVSARGEWSSETAWQVEGRLRSINPAAVHTAMAALPLSGRATVKGEGKAIAFDTDVQASGPAAPNPNAAPELAQVAALELRSLTARGRWAGNELALPLLKVRTSDASLDAALDLNTTARSGRGRADLEAPGLRLRGVGSMAARTGGGNVRLTLADIGKAQQWLGKLPGVPKAVLAQLLEGNGDVQANWQGGWDDPSVQALVSLPSLQPATASGTPAAWMVRDLSARADGRLADARIELKARALAGTRQADLQLAGRGGQPRTGEWAGELASLAVVARDTQIGPGQWRIVTRRPVTGRWASGRLDVSAGEATLVAPARPGSPSEAVLAWEPVHWHAGELRTAGRLSGLPLAWLELVGGPQLAGSGFIGDLVFDAQWDALLGDSLRLRASLARTSGDVSVLAETLKGTSTRVQAGVREARVTLDSDGSNVALALRWDSERAGTADGRVQSRLARTAEGWSWPEQAPLSGTIRAQLPRLGVWSLLAPPGWRLRGSVATDITVAGTRADPALAGTLRADDLALRSVVDGIALQDGRLRARFDGRRLLVDELAMRGAGPQGGSVNGSGEGSWQRDGLQVRVTAQLDRLRASARADRELVVSGQITGGLDTQGARIGGNLRVDRARIVLPDETAPRLGDDVVVRNLPPGVVLGRESRTQQQPGDPPARKVTLAVALDFGNDFRVRGRGIDTRLAGTLAIAGDSLAEPRLTGAINTIGGEYQAYGQRLDIERGVLRFTGPADNPALDILAVRPRLAQRVGVQITGSAQAPFVRLYAEPDLPEAEKLSWLVLGRPAAAGGAETALLQQAAVALLASRSGRTDSRGPASWLGLDELSFKREGAEGPAVMLGKRLGQNLYAAYERSLQGAVGTLFLYYDLSRRMTVRAQAGERAAVDLIFTFTYD
jgi:translocation and assembly module TamB